jgi:hypothetical protein
MRAGAKVAALAFAAGLLTATAGFAWYEHQDQPHMTSALNHLQMADKELKAAEHNKGGHREKAQEATESAIMHTQEGIKVGEENAK